MCVYVKEDPVFLSQCIDSIMAQTVLPDEWIVIKDGPITGELEAVLQNIKFPNELNIVSLPENVTLGPARAAGVEAAKHDWIAIMDSDDICLPNRFEKQIEMIRNNPELGLLGGQISEFFDDPECTAATRSVPTIHDDILRFAKKRNPFNHMTVMFRRELATRAGNYRYFPLFEDYDLWTRMLTNGTVCANHPDVLVQARIGKSTYVRRRGISYIKSEWRMQKQLTGLKLTNGCEFARNILLRIPVRLLPERLLATAYRKLAR